MIFFLLGFLNNFFFRLLHGADNLECMALTIQCLLKINRLELAKKVYIQMQEKDDDATLTQLALAWINIEIVSISLFTDQFTSRQRIL